jgi:hypothetical protein
MIMRGKTEQSTGEAATHGEVDTWVAEQLRRAAQRPEEHHPQAHAGRGAAIHSGKYSGEARVQLSWKLEDAK